MSVHRDPVPATMVRVDFIGLCALNRRADEVWLFDSRSRPTRHWPTLFVPNHPALDGTPDVVALPPGANASGGIWLLDDCALAVASGGGGAITFDDTPIADILRPTEDEARSLRMLTSLNDLYGASLNLAVPPPLSTRVHLAVGRVAAIPGNLPLLYQYVDEISGQGVYQAPRPLAASFEWLIPQDSSGHVTFTLTRQGVVRRVRVAAGMQVVVANACACQGDDDYLEHVHWLQAVVSRKRLVESPFEDEYPYDVRCGTVTFR